MTSARKRRLEPAWAPVTVARIFLGLERSSTLEALSDLLGRTDLGPASRSTSPVSSPRALEDVRGSSSTDPIVACDPGAKGRWGRQRDGKPARRGRYRRDTTGPLLARVVSPRVARFRTSASQRKLNRLHASVRFAPDFEVPKAQDCPAKSLEGLVRCAIPLNVARDLLVPVHTGLAGGERRGVTMPKGTVDEHCDSPARPRKVRSARQPPGVDPVTAETGGPRGAPE
jgi:hypothetical protein